MTDAQITRAYPDLPEELARVAVLGEVLDMAREMKLRQREIQAAKNKPQELTELISSLGLVADISNAEKTMTSTIVATLAQVSEQDLQAGLDLDLLSSEDHREALTVLRTMKLQRGRSNEQEQEFEA